MRRTALALMTMALTAAAFLPTATAIDAGLARTAEGGCHLVEWTDMVVVSPAIGCASSDPCVHVNWTTIPPQIEIVEC